MEEINLEKDTYEFGDIHLLGVGGYGTVWKVYRRSDGREVALKTVQHPASQGIIDALALEIEFLSQIEAAEEKHILPLLDHGEHNNIPVYVLPLADQSLNDFFENREQQPLKPADLLRWFEQIAIGLNALHSIQIEPHVHRDIKYHNVMLWNGDAFLSDFGTVKRIEHSLTQSLAGTLCWAAPETLLPKKIDDSGKPFYEFGPPADIYSLGLMIYGLVTGNFPSCQQKLLTKVDGNGNPQPGAERDFGKIGGLTDHERDMLEREAQDLFARPGEPLVQQGCMPLPNGNLLARKLVTLIKKLLAPDASARLTAKRTVEISRKLRHFLSPRLESFEIEMPDEIAVGNEFKVFVHAFWGFFPSFEEWLLDEEWLCITVGERQAEYTEYDIEGSFWWADFPAFQEEGEYDVSAWAIVNGDRVEAVQTVRMKDLGQLWAKGQHADVLIFDPNSPERYKEIYKKAGKGEKSLGYWISVLDEVREEHPNNEDLNYLYWKLRKKRNETLLRSRPQTLSDVYAFDSRFKNDFVKSRDGETVTDRATGLMWQQSGSDDWLTYKEAQAYVRELNHNKFAGYSDWRLPTFEELMSLMKREEVNDLYIDPVFDREQDYCLSADKRESGDGWVVVVYFATTEEEWDFSAYVRVVRS